MLLRIPDEYVTLIEHLRRNGIPFEVIEEEKDALEYILEELLKKSKENKDE